MPEMKSTLNEIKMRVYTTEEKTSELKTQQ